MMHNTFAVIGAGPAGLYAADRLLRAIPDAHVDVFEKNPVPMGLVRNGVAPDHPNIKRVETVLDRILDNPRLRLFTNVHVGVGRGATADTGQKIDLTLSELRAGYTGIILATGSSHARKLAIPGSQATNFNNAVDFVSWYNSAPDAPRNWDLTTPIIAIVGGGNVALDVARMLLRSPEDLKKTDVAPSVIDRYVHSAVNEIHIFIRRGPAQAKWTPQQLRDLNSLADVTLNFSERDFQQCADELAEPGVGSLSRSQRALLHAMDRLRRIARNNSRIDPDVPTDPSERSSKHLSSAQDRQVFFHFYSQPVEAPTDDDGEVAGLITDRTHLDQHGHAIAERQNQKYWHLSAVYSAIGYLPDGLGPLPRDPETGALRNVDGRVLGADGSPLVGVYATGWAKRGARGLIADTQADARALASIVVSDLQDTTLSDPKNLLFDPITVLQERGIRYGDRQGWHRVEQAERQAGEEDGRTVAKIADRAKLVKISAAR